MENGNEEVLELEDMDIRETNLVGNVHTHDDKSAAELELFMLELEKLMLNHKVTKVDLCLDPFEMLNEFAGKIDAIEEQRKS